jgi:phosphatidate phosphatase LPIN
MSEPPLAITEERDPGVDQREEVRSTDEREPVSSGDEREMKRADSEPPEFHQKPMSSSWVRWWNRSRDIREVDRPPLRVSNTSPMESVSFVRLRSIAAHDTFLDTVETYSSRASSYDISSVCISPSCHTHPRYNGTLE